MAKSNSCNYILLIFEMPEYGAMPFEWGILSTAKINEFGKKRLNCCFFMNSLVYVKERIKKNEGMSNFT